MKKIPLCFLITSFSFFLSFKKADASLIRVTKDGEVVKNVLSFKISDVQGVSLDNANQEESSKPTGSDSVLLSKDDGGVYLALGGEGKRYDINNLGGDIVEIEERDNLKPVKIITKDGKFILSQEGFDIETDKSIEIDSKSGNIFVESSLGKEFLSVLPMDAATTTLRSKYLTRITDASLVSDAQGDTVYRFEGERVLKVLGFLNYSVPVSADLSISTGEIVKVNQPVWLKIVGFLTT